jgi:membrane protein YdbS with pleckstrin-like domain
VIRKILRLPTGDPPLPDGDPDSVIVWKPGPGYLRYRLSLFFATGAPALLMLIGFLSAGAIGMMAELQGDAPAIVLAFIGLGLALVVTRILGGAAFGIYRIRLELDMLRYILTDEAVRLRRGVMEIEEITLSLANIQNVKMSQSFWQRLFGVSDLVVETAGGGTGEVGGHVGRILGVSEPEVLREAILERARAFKGSGLGQVTRRVSAPSAPTGGLSSPAAAALLQEIVADLRAIRLDRPQSQE